MRHIPGKIAGRDGNAGALVVLTAEEWAMVIRVLQLSPRQAQVVQLIFQAKKDKQIAIALGVNIWTVRTHLTRTFTRLGVADRVELVLHVFGILRNNGEPEPSQKIVTQ